jgi:ferredoxin
MELISRLLFVVLAGLAVWLFTRNIGRIRRNILLGKDEAVTGSRGERWKNVLLLAFGQKKMFKKPLVAVMHFVIYAGFIIINAEVLEIVLDGLLGTHRLFLVFMGQAYGVLIDSFEFLAAGVIIVCIVFLLRRNLLHIKRFTGRELAGWPKRDANFILVAEIILMSLFLTMNATDTLLQERGYGHYAAHLTGNFSLSAWLHPLLNGLSTNTLFAMERACWWLHIAGIFAFLNYLPYSKHLHILFAFPNAYYARLKPMGKMNNMPAIQHEVLYALQPELAPPGEAQPQSFGARDVTELSWRNLMDAYSCTECGRCTAVCPANITGKLLSPRKIMMDTRDRAEEAGKNNAAGTGAGAGDHTLLHHYISAEEVRACTACNACVEACPVSINPLEIIAELRRSLVMEESQAPPEWNALFSNVENNFAPWKFSPDDRDQWTTEM